MATTLTSVRFAISDSTYSTCGWAAPMMAMSSILELFAAMNDLRCDLARADGPAFRGRTIDGFNQSRGFEPIPERARGWSSLSDSPDEVAPLRDMSFDPDRLGIAGGASNAGRTWRLRNAG